MWLTATKEALRPVREPSAGTDTGGQDILPQCFAHGWKYLSVSARAYRTSHREAAYILEPGLKLSIILRYLATGYSYYSPSYGFKAVVLNFFTTPTLEIGALLHSPRSFTSINKISYQILNKIKNVFRFYFVTYVLCHVDYRKLKFLCICNNFSISSHVIVNMYN